MPFLPAKDKKAFVHEFVETVQVCASLGNSATSDETIHAWKSTAAIHSDPKLAAELKRPLSVTSAASVSPGLTANYSPMPSKKERNRSG
jgi:hypothetical protein